jgi:putative oxidoreductase
MAATTSTLTNATQQPTKASQPPSSALRIALWVAQVMLAVMFGFAGFMKTTMPIDVLAQQMIWPGAVPAGLVRFIGVCEIAAALGLIVPAATRIQPRLTPLAAAGLIVIMALATPFHLARGEVQALTVVLPLGALAVFVCWGRWKKAPIPPR